MLNFQLHDRKCHVGRAKFVVFLHPQGIQCVTIFNIRYQFTKRDTSCLNTAIDTVDINTFNDKKFLKRIFVVVKCAKPSIRTAKAHFAPHGPVSDRRIPQKGSIPTRNRTYIDIFTQQPSTPTRGNNHCIFEQFSIQLVNFRNPRRKAKKTVTPVGKPRRDAINPTRRLRNCVNYARRPAEAVHFNDPRVFPPPHPAERRERTAFIIFQRAAGYFGTRCADVTLLSQVRLFLRRSRRPVENFQYPRINPYHSPSEHRARP